MIDVTLPGLSGREAVRAIKDAPDLSTVKLVAMTAPLREGEQETLRQQGFDATLTKPFQVSQVVQVIEDAMAIIY